MEPTTIIGLAPDAIPSALAQYSVTEQVIGEIQRFASFEITDKPSYDTAAKAAAKIKKLRTSIEAKRKELKQPALDFGKAVDEEAKRLTSLIQPAENHLLGELKRVDDAEAARKAELHRQRSAQLQQAGFLFDGRFWMAGLYSLEAAKLADLTDEQFADQFQQGVKYLEGERARKEAEDRRRREEEERLAEQRRQLEAEKAAMAAKMAEYEELKRQQEARQAQVQQIRHEQAMGVAYQVKPDGHAEITAASVIAPADPFAGLCTEQAKTYQPDPSAWPKMTYSETDVPAPASDFAAGYEQAKADILRDFRNMEIRRTREQWIEFIANLKPAIF